MSGWSFWIDRGGTFTDCIAHSPEGVQHIAKVLSSDTAPLVAIRQVLEAHGGLAPGAPVPACDVKLGTTVATNALLERGGRRTLLVTNAGLGDVLAIGTQERPDLFDLDIRRPAPLPERVIECDVRHRADGVQEGVLDAAQLAADLSAAKTDGLESVAVLFIHAHAHPELEQQVAKLARAAGFEDVVCSHAIAREIGFLARGETVCADAYLTPLLAAHTAHLEAELPGSTLRFMQSSGGLTDARRFRGPGALLSGPAGGVVATAKVVGRAEGAGPAAAAGAIGFDMGGTSTDVSLVLGGEIDRAFETIVAGLRVRAPMLRIHTVAAGGGSLCRFDGFRQTVGPESAGSRPGPLCYGLIGGDGAPLASELAVTDVNLFLGRVQADRFPFEVDAGPVRAALERVRGELAEAGFERDLDEVAAGFVEIANASMAEAIIEVSVARGVDPRGLALVGFGGAGGQHVCAIARQLGMKTVLLHPLAGLLSAWGIGTAPITWDGQRDAAAVELSREATVLPAGVEAALGELAEAGRVALARDGLEGDAVRVERWLDLRYRGTDHPLALREPEVGDDGGADGLAAAFEAEHRTRFGYDRPERPIEIVTARVRAVGEGEADGDAAAPAPVPVGGTKPAPEPLRTDAVWFPGLGRVEAPIHLRESLLPGTELEGPAVLLEATGTVVLDPGFSLRVEPDGLLVLLDLAERAPAAVDAPSEHHRDEADPVRLEVFGARFKSMAEQMGAVLRNTSVSTNIKDRLDYSCAVFDDSGGLVANAPHIPVHLGAMAETVRAVRDGVDELGGLSPGDVVVTNDPACGGSHLPDVTVVTPVFVDRGDDTEGPPAFFVASRGHHAEIGGRTPGSMPPDSTRLEEEGIVLEPFKLVTAGRFDEAGVRARLASGPWPSRRPDDNVADLAAMVAANRMGEQLLQRFAAQEGLGLVRTTMHQLQRTAAAKVGAEIGRFEDGEHRFEDRLDDGTPVCVTLRIDGERMAVDFTGTGAPHPGNLNAPSAVVSAALIYVLRSLVDARLPLNGGCLDPVTVTIPEPSLLAPPPGAAVVGGNVETSQRVVDVLLGALGVAAASQGTMNNVTFGDAEFGYYETIGGGAGAGPGRVGASGVHTHMTNTRITDPEVLETRYPVLLERFALRTGSGGAGQWRGGDGLVREYRFLAPVTATLLTERRVVAPWGAEGGEPGARGENRLVRESGEEVVLEGRSSVELAAGDRLRVSTPGGGGWGRTTT